MVMAIILSVILLLLGFGMLVVVQVCIAGRAFRRGFGDVSVVERARSGNKSMSRDDLEKLPSYEYVTKDENRASSPMVECAVCLETFKMGEKCRLLPLCNHSFHAQCVDEWLLRTPICPICRTLADSRKSGGGGGDESGCFSDVSIELRGSQTSTTASSYVGESSQFSEINSSEFREIHQTQERSEERQLNNSNNPIALPQDVYERLPV
ncbi:hypothetical protein FNV43_RR14369 [Rhamnella rubrinervis]|uniref:RING-type E3 ubiquitin transferase n=1 Tax=Rhamnella rubrinervis TaxID=2594499 RepID=A0A8K0H2Q3_9ROSA|nr:hypothetical protein FNV43_RR14369 [Rhamnella rubrinervis]